MLGHNFYHGLTRKYVILFGTLFNDIYIYRQDTQGGGNTQKIKVPIAYGPREKFLARVNEDPTINRPVAIRLPRMGFEITGINYAPNRAISRAGKFKSKILADDETQYSNVFNPSPYDINFQLSIMVKTNEDGSRIIEQILPYFRPEFSITAKLLDDFPDLKLDIPVVLNSVSLDDTYDSDFLSRRSLTFVLDFTMKAMYFGPVIQEKIIKVAQVPVYTDAAIQADIQADPPTQYSQKVTTQPGLTAEGQPTTVLADSIDPLLIDEGDNYAYIVTTEEPNVA